MGEFTQFQEECLKAHNDYRDRHGVPHLRLSSKLCNFSQNWANTLVRMGRMQHSQNSGYGENIFQAWSSGANQEVSGAKAVECWYSEISKYTFGRESCNYMVTGHFTQVVWKSSTELGVGIARDNRGNVYVVSNYSPPGNYTGQYVANVPPPRN